MTSKRLQDQLPHLSAKKASPYELSDIIQLENITLPKQPSEQDGPTITWSSLMQRLNLDTQAPFALMYHSLDYPTKYHSHDYIEITYLAQGEILHLIDGHSYLMTAGSSCLIPQGTSHLLAPHGHTKASIINLLIRPEALEHFINTHLLSLPKQAVVIQTATAKQQLEQLVLAYFQEKHQVSLTTLGLVLLFLDSFVTHCLPQPRTDALAQHCLLIISQQAQTITQKELAKMLHYSPGYLSRHIKEQTSQTISYHITQAKLRLAQDLLATSNLPVEAIASSIGYQSNSHFYRLFKAHYHLTPYQYRKLLRTQVLSTIA